MTSFNRSFRPAVECLEGRAMPSTIVAEPDAASVGGWGSSVYQYAYNDPDLSDSGDVNNLTVSDSQEVESPRASSQQQDYFIIKMKPVISHPTDL